ncbi:septum formation protein Maf [Prosthecochloris sp. GSB1]|uniref:Maf family protein n=1 Tax=Prosthecochloris sp. GSB1 TaxID=281093 RepID=UPI000B8CE9D8|nr:Maf family protein [Prosthecochloris sp. GSB1]ASQ90311.1 septum formation protein Maf [Prosthecochloris sp. GSB1]
MPVPHIVLASGSPRRRELLSLMMLPFSTCPADIDETFDPGQSLEGNLVDIAEKKARAAESSPAAGTPGAILLGADTTVVFEGRPLGKPSGYDEAFATLSTLQGERHRVMTGFALVTSDGCRSRGIETTLVEFSPMKPEDIARYLETQRPYDKAGAYGIQDPLMSCFVRRIEGCYYNVVGLPVSRIHRTMRETGLL